jgi:hypothetical protein
MRGRIVLAFVSALVLLSAGIVFAAGSLEGQQTVFPSCAKSSVNSPADCASPCYFLNVDGQGFCAFGVTAFVGDFFFEGSRVRRAPTEEEVVRVLGVPGEPSPSPSSLSRELRSDFKPASNAVATAYDSIFRECGEQYGVPADRLRAHARVESNFNANAVSLVGARGLMQLMPCTAKELGLVSNPVCVKCRDGTTNCLACTSECRVQGVVAGSRDEVNILDPKKNVCAGALYLKLMFEKFGSWECAAAAYNAGPSAARKYSCNVPFPETKNYVAKVSQYYEEFSRVA